VPGHFRDASGFCAIFACCTSAAVVASGRLPDAAHICAGWMLQAHARLCARSSVTVQDAVMAVLILDSSMTGSSLMGWSNALHTHFPDDPDAEYELLERQVCGEKW